MTQSEFFERMNDIFRAFGLTPPETGTPIERCTTKFNELDEAIKRFTDLNIAAKNFMDSFKLHYHGFPSKLDWYEIHALQRAVNAIHCASDEEP